MSFLATLRAGPPPPKTLEQTRRLVEQDEVAFVNESDRTGGDFVGTVEKCAQRE